MPADFTVERTADDVAALAAALGIGRAHIAGFSGGSVTAQHLAEWNTIVHDFWTGLDART